MRRVLRPGGVALVLEFSPGLGAAAPAYDWYSFNVLPRLGKVVAGDEASYRYLAESIRMHPDQEALKAHDAGRRLRSRSTVSTSPRASSRCTSGRSIDFAARRRHLTP